MSQTSRTGVCATREFALLASLSIPQNPRLPNEGSRNNIGACSSAPIAETSYKTRSLSRTQGVSAARKQPRKEKNTFAGYNRFENLGAAAGRRGKISKLRTTRLLDEVGK